MKKICIACDTTSSFTLEEAKQNRIELIPLSVVIDGKEYKDNLEINNDDLANYLKQGINPTTSQPSVGYAQMILESWKDYDEIIVITLTSALSGTFQCLNLAKESSEMSNVHIVDSRTLAGAVKDAALEARKMADEGYDVEAILAMLDRKFKNTSSYLVPATLEQLKRGGRITPLAASMASTLKLKPVLSLQDNGNKIDKYGIARTDRKCWQMVMDALDEEGVNSETHRLYVVQFTNLEGAEKVKAILEEHYPGMEIIITDIPAVLACHAGLGVLAVQSVIK